MNPNNQSYTLDYIYTFVITICIQQSNEHHFTILRMLCMMSSWCCIGPVLLSSLLPYGSLASSTAADHLLILFPTGRARPPASAPLPIVTPFPSGSMHSFFPLSVAVGNIHVCTICAYGSIPEATEYKVVIARSEDYMGGGISYWAWQSLWQCRKGWPGPRSW